MFQTAAAFDTLLPRASTPMHHICSSFPFTFISLHLCLAMLSAPPIPTSPSLPRDAH
jgi:hypothetical protein